MIDIERDIDHPEDVLSAAVAGWQPRGDRWAMARIGINGEISLDVDLRFQDVMAELQRTASRTFYGAINWRMFTDQPPPPPKRKITPEARWTVLRRDDFRCTYCGATAPDAKLHVDHKRSVKDGGSDDLANLVTACQDCNLGKGARSA